MNPLLGSKPCNDNNNIESHPVLITHPAITYTGCFVQRPVVVVPNVRTAFVSLTVTQINPPSTPPDSRRDVRGI